MKKIINNKVYDTSTAHEIGYDGSGDGFHRWHESLYQKRTGEYFLHGEGGPMTKYAVSLSDNSWTYGEKIIPLTPDAARKWVEEHLDADAYEALFGLPEEEDAAKVTISAQLPAPLITAARRMAYEDGTSLTSVIEKALSLYTSEMSIRLYRVVFFLNSESYRPLVMVQQRPDGRWKIRTDFSEPLDDRQCKTLTVTADSDLDAIDAALRQSLSSIGDLDIVGHEEISM